MHGLGGHVEGRVRPRWDVPVAHWVEAASSGDLGFREVLRGGGPSGQAGGLGAAGEVGLGRRRVG